MLRRNALKWLKGEYKTKTEARQELGVREIINDLKMRMIVHPLPAYDRNAIEYEMERLNRG